MNVTGSLEMPEPVADLTPRLSRPAAASNEPYCACATTLEQVESAWGLVYDRYSDMGLIDENPYGVHAVPTAVGPHTSVIWGPEGPEVGYTLTLVHDGPRGIALDSVYRAQLDGLRRGGRRLLEVGMLADRRRSVARSIGALFSMMRWAAYDVLHNDLTDIVIGVHPRHSQFYVRSYGFEEFAPATSYALVKDHPVVGLRLRLREGLAKDILPRGLSDVRDHPIPASAFARRFMFDPEQLHGSRLEGYLRARYGIGPAVPASGHAPFPTGPACAVPA